MVIRIIVLIAVVLFLTGCSGTSGYGSLETKHNAFFEVMSLDDKLVLKHVGGEPIFLNETGVNIYKCERKFESCKIFDEITFSNGTVVSKYGVFRSQSKNSEEKETQDIVVKEGDVIILVLEQEISLSGVWLKVEVENIPLSKVIASKEVKPKT